MEEGLRWLHDEQNTTLHDGCTAGDCRAIALLSPRAEGRKESRPNLVWLEREEVGRFEVAKDIADAALAWVEDTGGCHFCDYGYPARGDAHDPTCPMVPYKDGALPSFSAASAKPKES